MSALEYLIGCYFHQDWDVEADSARGVLDRFVAEDGPERAREARAGALELLDAGLSEEELERALDGMGLQYAPDYEGLTHRDFLRLVADHLGAVAGAGN